MCSGLAMPSVPFCASSTVQVEDLSAQAQANAAQHLAGVERQDLSQEIPSDISIVCCMLLAKCWCSQVHIHGFCLRILNRVASSYDEIPKLSFHSIC